MARSTPLYTSPYYVKGQIAQKRFYAYSGVSDTDPPVSDRKELRVQALPVNCTAAKRRTSMTARFDNVMLDS
jgi:hypothetical protein